MDISAETVERGGPLHPRKCRAGEAKRRLSGADGRFVEATGRINTRNQLVVSSREVKSPLWVRYCFSDDAVGNLFNREGLPVAPFRTDDL